MYGMKRRRVEVTWILNWQIKEELEKKVNPNNLLVHILKSLKSYVHIASCSRPAGGFNLHECSSTEAKGWMTGWPWKHSEGHWNAVSPVRLRGASLTGHILLFSFLRFFFYLANIIQGALRLSYSQLKFDCFRNLNISLFVYYLYSINRMHVAILEVVWDT